MWENKTVCKWHKSCLPLYSSSLRTWRMLWLSHFDWLIRQPYHEFKPIVCSIWMILFLYTPIDCMLRLLFIQNLFFRGVLYHDYEVWLAENDSQFKWTKYSFGSLIRVSQSKSISWIVVAVKISKANKHEYHP